MGTTTIEAVMQMVNPPMNDTRELEYRKTATIRAVQWFRPGDHPAVKSYADQLGVIKGLSPYGWCPTLEGGHVVTPGDWIATGIKGEHWPIKPDVFAATYEPVSSSPPEGGDKAGGVGTEVQTKAIATLRALIPQLDSAAQPTKCEVFTACGYNAAEIRDAIAALQSPPPPRPAGPTREEIAAIILESQPPKGFKHRWPNALAKADAILALFTGGRG